jgi:hypothetical protein
MSIRNSVLPSSTKAPNYGVLLLVLVSLIVVAPVATRAGWAFAVEALYLAVMIARLVGLHIADGMFPEENGP